MSGVAEGKGPVGYVPIFVGLAIVVIGFLDSRDFAFPAGRAPVFFAGCAFILAGAAMLINAMTTPYRSALLAANSTCLLACLALVPASVFWKTAGSGILLIAVFAFVALLFFGLRATIKEFCRVKRSLPRKDG